MQNGNALITFVWAAAFFFVLFFVIYYAVKLAIRDSRESTSKPVEQDESKPSNADK